MKLINSTKVKDLYSILKQKNFKRVINEEDFMKGTKTYYDCYVIPSHIKIPFLVQTSNVFICDEHNMEVIDYIYNKIERTHVLKNVCSLTFQENDINAINQTEDLFMMQILKAFKIYKLNGIESLCAIVKFYKSSNRYEVTIFMESKEINKIKKIFNEIL